MAPFYDALVIGAGPGGLSAALGLGRQSRSCLVLSHHKFRNDGIAASHAVLGHDHVHPQDILSRSRTQIARYQNTSFAYAEIMSITKTQLPYIVADLCTGSSNGIQHQGFKVTSKEGETWEGKTIVLATGVRDILPQDEELPGYRVNWPRNIFQCLFCDGWERRQKQKAVLCLPAGTVGMMELGVAGMALGQDRSRNRTDGSAKVTLLVNGRLDLASIDKEVAHKIRGLKAQGVRFDERTVTRLEDAGDGIDSEGESGGVFVHLKELETEKVERVFFGYIAHKPRTTLNAPHLIDQLGLEVTDGVFGDVIKTNAPMATTNVPGVFVAGDCGNGLTHVTTAMSSGVGAAAALVHYLNDLEMEYALAAEDERQQTVASGL